MSAYLVMLGLIAVLFLLNVILSYRNRIEQAKHKAEIQKTVLEAVTATAQHRRRLDDDLAIVEEKHRVETTFERSHLADRTDFNDDWDGLPNHASGYVAPNSGATAAGPASVADD
jgi:predicted Holliday junction resolvase-like endonuclease